MKFLEMVKVILFGIEIMICLAVPCVIISEMYTQIKEQQSRIEILTSESEASKKEIRLLKQDVEILNNIIISSDYLKK